MNDSPAIQTHALCKSFGDKVAVKDLSLTVERGEVFGFLGPNGAGKTTSVKMLLSLVAPSGGEGFLFGRPLNTPEVRTRIGFLPEHFRFHDWLTGREFLALHAELYHMQRQAAAKGIEALLDLVGLSPHANK
jgi:ABC-2 type transport system ATP-binding protein